MRYAGTTVNCRVHGILAKSRLGTPEKQRSTRMLQKVDAISRVVREGALPIRLWLVQPEVRAVFIVAIQQLSKSRTC